MSIGQGNGRMENKMINFNAYVIELEADNSYKVCIENVYKGIVTNDGLIDDSVTTFESALSTVIEIMLSDDYDYVEVSRGLSQKGRLCRKYVISVDDGGIDNNKPGKSMAYRVRCLCCVLYCSYLVQGKEQ